MNEKITFNKQNKSNGLCFPRDTVDCAIMWHFCTTSTMPAGRYGSVCDNKAAPTLHSSRRSIQMIGVVVMRIRQRFALWGFQLKGFSHQFVQFTWIITMIVLFVLFCFDCNFVLVQTKWVFAIQPLSVVFLFERTVDITHRWAVPHSNAHLLKFDVSIHSYIHTHTLIHMRTPRTVNVGRKRPMH